MKRISLTLILLIPLLIFSQIINIPNDYPTIQQGINAASNGDTILVNPGIYYESIDFIGKDITIASLFLMNQDTSYISQTIIDGGDLNTVVEITKGEDSTTVLCGFTIQNGHSIDWDEAAGIFCQGSRPRLRNLVVRDNYGRISGGIRCENASIELTNVDLLSNESWSSSGSGGMGGGIYCYNSSVGITDCRIIGNIAGTQGGGIYCETSYLTLNNVIIKNDTANACDSDGHGGGICARDSEIVLTKVSIHNNYSGEAGGMWCSESDILFDTIDLCNLYSNSALWTRDIYSDELLYVTLDTFSVQQPTEVFASPLENFIFNIQNGIIQQENADLFVSPIGDNTNTGLTSDEPLKTIDYAFMKIISDSINRKKINLLEGTYSKTTNGEIYPIYMIKNVDLCGVADSLVILDASGYSSTVLYLRDDQFNIKGITITGGFSWNGTGGLHCQNMNGTIENVIISDNISTYSGGGISISQCSDIKFINISFSYNEANFGSAIRCSGGSDPIFINNLIYNNSGYIQDEGAVYVVGAYPTFINCTMTNNGNRSIISRGSNTTIVNSIMWNQIAEAIKYQDLSTPSSVTISYSDIEGGENGINTNGSGTVNWQEGNINSDPLFMETGYNPYSLSGESPCIDKGNPDTSGLNIPSYDILMNIRIWDGDNDGDTIIDMGAYEYGSLPVGIDKPIVFTPSQCDYYKLFPNPTHSSITIELPTQPTKNTSLTISNTNGQQLISQPITKPQTEIDIGSLPAGIYIVKVWNDKEVMVQKVIKQ